MVASMCVCMSVSLCLQAQHLDWAENLEHLIRTIHTWEWEIIDDLPLEMNAPILVKLIAPFQ